MRLNVRCCCQPTKILGTLEVPDSALPAGRFPVARMVTCRFDAPWPTRTKIELLEVRVFVGDFGEPEPAVYAEERPIEYWRALPGFREGDQVR